MKKINVTIKGVTPFLYNRFLDRDIDTGGSKRRTGALEKPKLEDKLYMLPNGIPYIPAIYLRNALVEAGKQFKITGKGKSTYSKMIGATVDITPECIENKNKFIEYRVAAVNPMTKGRMMVSRPRMDIWGCSFEIILNDDSIPESVMKEVLEHAGKYVGIGDWRPDKKGIFGKFMVTEFKEV